MNQKRLAQNEESLTLLLKKLLSKYVDKSLVNSATLGTMLTPEGRAIDGTLHCT